jgi:hypothetical protein
VAQFAAVSLRLAQQILGLAHREALQKHSMVDPLVGHVTHQQEILGL